MAAEQQLDHATLGVGQVLADFGAEHPLRSFRRLSGFRHCVDLQDEGLREIAQQAFEERLECSNHVSSNQVS
jgi:hypothetical protein